ncbi:MAG TPA: hypothetical protein PLB26_09870 [Rubrivivax sp.]|nr:hypothetical protein [Rubrivivax sp.]
MVWFWIVAIGVVLYLMFKGGGGSSSSASSRNSSSGTGATGVGSDAVGRGSPSGKGYRPKSAGGSSSGISFGSAGASAAPTKLGEQVTDFVTGAALRTSASTYQCSDCLAYYSPESFDLLRSENGGRCASCRSVNLRALGGQRPQGTQRAVPPSARAAGPGAATLSNFRSFEGQVVTFTGRVIKVLESRRGGDFAVMFEDKSWKHGFKLVFFKGALSAVGGPAYVRNLRGTTISVRGLIVNHSQFGYEIIVNDRRMVLRVDQ